MNVKPKKIKRDPDLDGADIALRRAVAKVRERAAQTGRPIVFLRDGKIVHEVPKIDKPGLSAAVAEEFSPYGIGQQEAVLRVLRLREGLTQKRLAELSGIPQHQISEMENGKRSIGKERAKRLAEALHCDYRQLL
jgi:DNA-binding XRE family transcriptional regulator